MDISEKFERFSSFTLMITSIEIWGFHGDKCLDVDFLDFCVYISGNIVGTTTASMFGVEVLTRTVSWRA
jgi:hypothetical protein